MKPADIIGKNIKKIREEKGIKQETLAKYLNVTKGRISQIEHGDCEGLTLKQINKMAIYFNVDFFELAGKSYQNDYFKNITKSINFSSNHNNISADIIKSLADELINRLPK
jgi:transcriptional regulator with XRE-family HTH domain